MKNLVKQRSEAGQGAFMRRVFDRLQDDQNLTYLAARLRNESEITEAHIDGLRGALELDDAAGVESFAHELSDSTAKIGAIKMMKLSVALQMLGRRGLIKKAAEIFVELEQEYLVFKQNLMPNVG